MVKELWALKYRPKTLADYVWINDAQREQVTSWVEEKSIPHLLLIGHTGVGKTSLAMMLMAELGVDSSDIKLVNGSSENGVDFIRGLENFIGTMAFGDCRYVIIDECDFLTTNAQAALRNMIESYSNNARFILTANYGHKVIPALKGRCQSFEIESLNKQQFLERIATILVSEGVELTENNLEILDDYINVSYPDLRKCINLLQQNCNGTVLKRPDTSTAGTTAEVIMTAVAMFRNGQIREARQFLSPKLSANEFEDAYKLLYQNLDWFGTTQKQQDCAIVVIANSLRDHAVVADPEICFAACLVQLEEIANS